MMGFFPFSILSFSLWTDTIQPISPDGPGFVVSMQGQRFIYAGLENLNSRVMA